MRIFLGHARISTIPSRRNLHNDGTMSVPSMKWVDPLSEMSQMRSSTKLSVGNQEAAAPRTLGMNTSQVNASLWNLAKEEREGRVGGGRRTGRTWRRGRDRAHDPWPPLFQSLCIVVSCWPAEDARRTIWEGTVVWVARLGCAKLQRLRMLVMP
jgi:hypothetical protein